MDRLRLLVFSLVSLALAACSGGSEEAAECGSACVTPPAATCAGSTLTEYGFGTCVDGACSYTPTVTTCSGGDVCTPQGCTPGPDLCDGVACTEPPGPACEGDSVVTFTSPGTCSAASGAAACDYAPTTRACRASQMCVGGACVDRPCAGVDCDVAPAPECEGDIAIEYLAPGTCAEETGACVFTDTRTDCATLGQFCGDGVCQMTDPCEGVVCDDPPADFCTGEILTRHLTTGSCSSGTCGYGPTTTDCALLGQRCRDNTCRDRLPCEDIVCDEPPVSFCVADVARIYGALGECDADACIYTPTVVDCAALSQVCAAGRCVTPTPCDGVTCEAPPAAFCEGEVAVTFASPGTCEDGVCRYVESRADCAPSGALCVAGSCETFDPCDGVTCDAPPGPVCAGGVAISYALPGSCIDGTCQYAEDTDDCAAADAVCTGGVCVDLCAGVVCDTPPPAACEGSVAITYVGSGLCALGACDYSGTEERVDCATAGAVCHAGGCVAPGTLLAEGDLFVTELMIRPASETTFVDAWFEVRSGGASGSLAGLAVANGRGESFTVPAGVTVEYGGSVVFAERAGIVPGAATVWPAGFSLHAGDTLTLSGAGEVDAVVTVSGGFIPEPWAFTAGASLQLDLGLTGVENDTFGAWCDAPTAYADGLFGTPGVANDVCHTEEDVGSLYISEVMSNGVLVADGVDYWIEVHNGGELAVRIYGLRLTSTIGAYVVEADLSLAAGDALLIGRSAFSGGGADVSDGGALDLDPGGDVVAMHLSDIDADVVDYRSGTWPMSRGVAMQFGSTSARPLAANDYASSWCAATIVYPGFGSNLGTPGAANDLCASATCSGVDYTCDDATCIGSAAVCDEIIDCPSGDDELFCLGETCGPDEFQCGDLSCIPGAWVCDGEDDCPGGEDELSCV